MSFGFLLLGVLETLRVSIPSYTEGILHTARRERTNARIFAWSRRLVEEAGIAVETEGLEHAAGDEPFVVMSNHQSLYDIPVVFQAVQHLIHPPVELAAWPDKDRRSRVVFITRGVSEWQVRDLFAACEALGYSQD